MATPKPSNWKLGVIYTDVQGGSRQEVTENITEATAKSRAVAACKAGCWIKPDDLGLKLLIPPHRIRGIFIKRMEKTMKAVPSKVAHAKAVKPAVPAKPRKTKPAAKPSKPPADAKAEADA